MVEVTFRDLFSISIVMGIMAGTMTTMLGYFSAGMEGDPMASLKFGAYFGSAVTSLTLIYGGWRLIELKRGRGNKVQVDKVAQLRELLTPLEAYAAGLPWASEKAWRISTHIRQERGTLTLDLHEMDLPGARRILDLIIENRPMVGRIRIITGRGKNSQDRPVLRPMVNERLTPIARALDWQILAKAGSITLRPLGKRPTLKVWLVRFLFLIGPFSIALALSFEELAGSGAREQGRIFGAAAGLVLTGLLASYRNRV
jgi:hypothetical protein